MNMLGPAGTLWTLVLPRSPYQFMADYRRMLAKYVMPVHPCRIVTLDSSRPVLSKYFHLPRFMNLRRGPGAFHLEQTFLPDLALVPLPRCAVTIWDLCAGLHPHLYPSHAPERIDARLGLAGARRAGAIITVSRFQRDELAERLPFPGERIHVAGWAVDEATFTPGTDGEREAARLAICRNHGIDPEDRIVLSLSGWQPRKNVPGILKTVRRLLDRGRRVRLLMRYRDTRRLWRQPIEKLIGELKLGDVIVWMPPLDDPLRIQCLRSADLLLFPSYYEGFGIPPLEAMACGCPVVASTAGPIPEVVGDAGLLREPDDVEGLADAAEQVFDDEAMRARLKRQGLDRARLFTWETSARAHLEAYAALSAS